MMKPNLDAILSDIRNEEADPAIAVQAADRVRARLFNAADEPGAHLLGTCGDFRVMMRGYLDKTLSRSRTLLLEDHVHTCVGCRRALDAMRSGKVVSLPRPQIVERELPPYMKWAAAAAVFIAVGLTAWGIVRMMPSAGARATVQSVSGILYAVRDQSSTPIFSGREIGDGQSVRTAKQSTASLKLTDGSVVELNERAEVSITKSARGTTIRLDRGNIIVQAAKQKNGALYVLTPDCQVSVHGTVFAVTRGTKGTRVSVAEGEVKVDEGGHSELLHPGEQTSTSVKIEKIPVQDEFAWSRNATHYLSLLGEFTTLQKQIAGIPSPELRYGSKLLDLVPWNTAIYAAVPNLGSTLAGASRLFNERIQQSEVLREWWAQNQPKGGHTLDEIIGRLRSFSDYLGDEVVLTISGDWGGHYSDPMLVAEIKRPGLREFLEAQARELGSNGQPAFRVVDEPRAEMRSDSKRERQPLILLKDNIIAISTDPEMLANMAEQHRAFAHSYFHNVIQRSYDSGAGWLFCANLEQIMRNSVFKRERDRENSPTGLQDVRYLIYERKERYGNVDNRVALTFMRERRGFASWLGAPGPMGALEFVSPNALLASGFVLKNPRALLSDVLQFAESRDSEFVKQLTDFEQRSGVNFLNDLAGPLGTDAAFAIDGPIFPVPSWQFAMEVYSPDRLQWTIEKLVENFNRESGREDGHHAGAKLSLVKNESGGRTFYSLSCTGANVEAHYTYVDSYLVAAATQGMLLRAIQNHQNGYTLTRSEKFRALLPRDSYPNFSGLIYHNVGPLIGPIAEQLKSLSGVSEAQKQSLDALQANTGAGLIFAYGEQNRIVISGTGPLFGLNLETLAVPNIIANAMRGREGGVQHGPHLMPR